MTKTTRSAFSWGSFLKALAAVAVPIALQNLLTTTASMVDMVLPAVLISGFALQTPYWAIFLCRYIDEPIRYVLMQIHLYSGKWIRPVTDKGLAALPVFREQMARYYPRIKAVVENKKKIW